MASIEPHAEVAGVYCCACSLLALSLILRSLAFVCALALNLVLRLLEFAAALASDLMEVAGGAWVGRLSAQEATHKVGSLCRLL